MKRRLRTSVGVLAFVGLVLAVSAPAPAKDPDPQAPSGKGLCINPTDIAKQDIVSDKEIRFTMRNGDLWANSLPQSCSGLKSEGGFEWVVRGTLVCSNQQSITVLRRGTPCLLGEFTQLPKPVKPPKPAN
jgi:hypothetical protein